MNRKVLAGLGLLVSGFILYQLGFASATGEALLDSIGLVIVQNNTVLNGLAFEVTGGAIFLIGLVMAIAGVESSGRIQAYYISQQLERKLSDNFSTLEKALEKRITANDSDIYNKLASLERAVRNLKPTATVYAGYKPTATQEATAGKCKFCNSNIEPDTIFCPSCGKSQV